MAKKIPCAGDGGRCDERATLSIQAFGESGWAQKLYCDKHAGRVIRLRGKLVRKYALNVVVRPITDRDRKLRKAAVPGRKKRG